MLTAESEHGLCSKREVIISKFDALLVKMGGVELAIKIENGQATHLSMEAERSWQKAETMYRLRMEEVKESQGALKLAEDEYSKWRTVYKAVDEQLQQSIKQKKNDIKAKEKLVADAKGKMMDWEQKLVTLGKTRDRAASEAAAGADVKEKLNGMKVVALRHANATRATTKLELPPLDKQLFAISMIKKKVNELCRVAVAPAAAASSSPAPLPTAAPPSPPQKSKKGDKRSP
jgi:hypothetical protein